MGGYVISEFLCVTVCVSKVVINNMKGLCKLSHVIS